MKDREALTKLLNDDKTKRDTLLSAQDQLESAQRKVDTLAAEEANLLRRKENVGRVSSVELRHTQTVLTLPPRQATGKEQTLQSELKANKGKLDELRKRKAQIA